VHFTGLDCLFNCWLVFDDVDHIRDAPIIGIGRLLFWYRPIVIYYVLWWHWIL